MKETVYFNNELINIEDARLSPNDRGFIFADGVYEVIKYYNGFPFRYNEHIERLKRSLYELSINYQPLDVLQNIFHELLVINKLDNQHAGIYLQITRGVNKRVHYFPEDISPTVYAFAFKLPSNTYILEKGIKVITQQDIRWLRCDIKSVSLLPNTMLYNNAVNKGAGESILIRNGFVSEATHSSVFGVKNDVLYTQPLNNLILPGITRNVVLEISNDNNIVFEEKAISEKELVELDEIFITGTGSEVTPVIQVDDYTINNKKPGKITRLIQEKFFEMV